MGTPITTFPIQTENPSEIPPISLPVVNSDLFVAIRGGIALGTFPASALPLLSSLANTSNGSGADLVANAVRFCPTFANLQSLTASVTIPTCVAVGGKTTMGDYGAGLYVYKSSDVSSTDDGFNVAVDIAGRRWHRVGQFLPVWGGTSTGTGSAYVLTPPFLFGAYVAGMRFSFIAHTDSLGGTTTLNISGLGATLLLLNGNPPAIGELASGTIVEVIYDGTSFQLVNQGVQANGQGQDTPSAATVNLSNLSGDIVNITGSTAITSFGSPRAGTRYYLRIAGGSGATIVEGGNIVTGRGTIGNGLSIYLIENVNISGTVFSYVTEIYSGGGGLVQGDIASIVNIQSAANVPQAINPNNLQYSPFAIKAWANIVGSTGGTTAKTNVSSVLRNGTGDYTITFFAAMTDVKYLVLLTAGNGGAGGPFVFNNALAAKTTTTCRVGVFNLSGTAIDPLELDFAVIGN